MDENAREIDDLGNFKMFLWIAILVNLFLLVIKAVGAIMSQSLTLLADTYDTALDILAAVVTYFGAVHARRAPDDDHHFGHSKIENLAALAIPFFMAFTVYSITTEAISQFNGALRVEFNWIALASGIVSIAFKLFLSLYLAGLAKRVKSDILADYAREKRLDVLASMLSVLAVLSPTIGWRQLDIVGGLLIALLITIAAIDIAREHIATLLDKAPGKIREHQVLEIIEGTLGVVSAHKLRLRKAGSGLIGDVHIQVDPDLTIQAAHEISANVNVRVRDLADVHNFLVHIEPVGDGENPFECNC